MPGAAKADQAPSQATETTIGPFELQDFIQSVLHEPVRISAEQSRIPGASRVGQSRAGPLAGRPPEDQRRQYSLGEIKRWLAIFIRRFYALSQFKRSCLPNGPKVGSGGSLSPRSDWRAPTDAEVEVWLRELSERVPQ